jgi:hypothetical protein
MTDVSNCHDSRRNQNVSIPAETKEGRAMIRFRNRVKGVPAWIRSREKTLARGPCNDPRRCISQVTPTDLNPPEDRAL